MVQPTAVRATVGVDPLTSRVTVKLSASKPTLRLDTSERQKAHWPKPVQPPPPDQVRTIAGTSTPLLVFVNSRSGANKGQGLLEQFVAEFGEAQVCDLGKVGCGGPNLHDVLTPFVGVSGTRVLVCGGDGTCSWLLTAIARACEGTAAAPETTLPVAVMPLGTGNDLSRALGWGHGFMGKVMRDPAFLQRVGAARRTQLDRWSITLEGWCEGLPRHFRPIDDGNMSVRVTPGAVERAEGGEGRGRHRGVFINYLGLGLEAATLHAFHKAREANPSKFARHRLLNQAKLLYYGVPVSGVCAPCLGPPYPQLAQCVRMHVQAERGGAWDELELPPRLRAIIFLNIKSHAAGRNMWAPVAKGFHAQSACDGVLEVAGLSSATHFGLYLTMGRGVFSACSGRALAQATAVRFTLLEPIAMQSDGEPWLQPAGEVLIEHAGASAILESPKGTERKARREAPVSAQDVVLTTGDR